MNGRFSCGRFVFVYARHTFGFPWGWTIDRNGMSYESTWWYVDFSWEKL